MQSLVVRAEDIMLEVPPIMPFFYASNYARIPPYYARKMHAALWQLEEPGSET